ncbi:hypothetical protein WAE61_04255 [Comamonadaceae bacterium PP-2]
MSSYAIPTPRTGRWVAAASLCFVAIALGSLLYVCSRPQTPSIAAAERHTIARCFLSAEEPRRSPLSQYVRAEACREMTKQFTRKYGVAP